MIFFAKTHETDLIRMSVSLSGVIVGRGDPGVAMRTAIVATTMTSIN